jgi:hypothetical protein
LLSLSLQGETPVSGSSRPSVKGNCRQQGAVLSYVQWAAFLTANFCLLGSNNTIESRKPFLIMNTVAIHMPINTARATMLGAPAFTFCKQGAKIQAWAFGAAVRLSDQNKPIVLKLLVELAIVLRMLALLGRRRARNVAKVAARRPGARAAVRHGKPANRPFSPVREVPRQRRAGRLARDLTTSIYARSRSAPNRNTTICTG